MKKLYLLLLAMSSIFFVSCSNMEVGFEKESPFYRGGVVYIYLAKDMKSDEKYRVYINGEDTDISLMPGYKTRFGIKAGDTRIEIVHARETADINMHLKASKNYYLRVQKDENGKIEILQILNDSIDSSVATTPLYVDEKEQKVSGVKKDVKKVEEKSIDAPKEGETTFYYDPLEGE